MKKHTTLKSKFNSAFSLVELLVVIAVIAVIAAIAIPNITGTVAAANDSKKLANAAELVKAYNSYIAALEASGGTPPAAPSVTTALAILNANNGVGTAVGNQTFGLGNLTEANIDTAKVGVSGVQLYLIQ